MKYAIDFVIYSENPTLRGDVDVYIPSKEDGRVFNEEYDLKVGKDEEDRYAIRGNIKCNTKSDAEIVLNNIKTLVKQRVDKVGEDSFIALGKWMHDEPVPTKCTRTILWSK